MKTPSDFLLWLSNYESGIINITDEIQFDTYQKLKDIERMKNRTYLNTKFPDGMDKLAYNLGHILHFTLYRFSDKDAKELELQAQTDEGLRVSNFFKAMLRGYLYDSNYDQVMNRDRGKLLDGHLMTKEVKNKSYPVRLLNIIRDWSDIDFEKKGLAEKTFPGREKLDIEVKDQKAEAQLELILKDTSINENDICIYEWWTTDKFDGEQTKGCIRYLDCRRWTPQEVKDGNSDWMPFIELDRFKTPATRVVVDQDELDYWKEKGQLEENRIPCYPYKEQRFFELEGRALGVGVWEMVEGLIEHFNENWNNKRRFDQLAAKGLTVYTRNSKDRSITQEFLNSIDTNAVLEIKPGEKLERFNIGSITIDHLATVDKIFEIARQTLGIAPSAVIEPKASQSATSATYEQENAKSTYAIIGELLSLYYQELFRDFKIPSIIKHLSKQRVLKLMGSQQEIDEIEAMLSDNLINSGLKKSPYPFKSSVLQPEEEAQIKQAMKVATQRKGTTRFLPKLSKKLLDMFQYDIIFYASSTSFDKREKVNVYNEMLMDARQNPMSKYSADKIQDAKLDLFDINPRRFEKTPEEFQQAQAMIQEQQMEQPNPQPV